VLLRMQLLGKKALFKRSESLYVNYDGFRGLCSVGCVPGVSLVVVRMNKENDICLRVLYCFFFENFALESTGIWKNFEL
jgi:hypothetical protein